VVSKQQLLVVSCSMLIVDCLVVYSFHEHTQQQKSVLRRQVAIALELNLPIVIHSRDSERDIIEELEKVCLKIAQFLRCQYLIYVVIKLCGLQK